MELISAYTGIGSGRPAAAATSAVPPERDPVKPTALMRGSVTSAVPRARPDPKSSEKVPARKSSAGNRVGDRLGHQFRGPGVCVVGFHDDGAAGGQGGRGVAPGHREREGKVTCAEHHDGPQRNTALPNVGTWQRLAIGLGGVDPRFVPAAFADHAGEHPQLAAGAADFTGESGLRQAGLGVGTVDELVGYRVDVVGDGVQELRAPLRGRVAVVAERRGGRVTGGLHMRLVAMPVCGLEFAPGVGVEAADFGTGSAHP